MGNVVVTRTGDFLTRGGNLASSRGTATLSSSYATSGDSVTIAQLGLGGLEHLDVRAAGGYVFEWDRSKTAPKVKAFRISGTPQSVTFTDDNSASSNGVAMYLHIDEVFEQGNYIGHLEIASPTDVDATLTINNGGPTLKLQDDDNAATGGFQITFDEDGTLGSRILANVTGSHNAYVMLSDGSFLKITHSADAATNGMDVFVDEDATNSYERILFTSPTDVNGSDNAPITPTTKENAVLQEVPSGTSLTGTTFTWEAYGYL